MPKEIKWHIQHSCLSILLNSMDSVALLNEQIGRLSVTYNNAVDTAPVFHILLLFTMFCFSWISMNILQNKRRIILMKVLYWAIKLCALMAIEFNNFFSCVRYFYKPNVHRKLSKHITKSCFIEKQKNILTENGLI